MNFRSDDQRWVVCTRRTASQLAADPTQVRCEVKVLQQESLLVERWKSQSCRTDVGGRLVEGPASVQSQYVIVWPTTGWPGVDVPDCRPHTATWTLPTTERMRTS